MKALLLMCLFLTFNSEIVICDFTSLKETNKWYQTSDDVMGGISKSEMLHKSEGVGVFTGEVSTANNGGFAMTRLPVDIKLTNKVKKIVLRVKGDGKMYQFRIKANSGQRYWYVYKFLTTTEMEEIEIPLEKFYPSYRGYRLNKNNFSSNTIKEIGILIGNKKSEDFKLIIDKISIK
ncbi:CIA30 family protein [Pseudofulvibacter geojedonensis]|uniref:CIA30 family protein n=1 Tax=Pseudofulvibacter geojedonensis TaxID=1123758 RepID=A0ABW3I2B0_9FLAO